jgi:hypothetical protein
LRCGEEKGENLSETVSWPRSANEEAPEVEEAEEDEVLLRERGCKGRGPKTLTTSFVRWDS